MAAPSVVFKKAPAREVQLGVQFSNTLEVADNRSKFHRMIAKEFPIVIMPEQNKLAYDFGDYVATTQNLSDRLEISMSYFRLVTSNYPGYDSFERLFLSCLSMFCKCYEIRSFSQLAMQYQNELPVPAEKGFTQGDLFAIELVLPESLGRLTAARGSLFFEKPEGLVALEIDPNWTGDKITLYKMRLTFFAQRELAFDDEGRQLQQLIREAHGYLKRLFLSSLRMEYIDYLKAL